MYCHAIHVMWFVSTGDDDNKLMISPDTLIRSKTFIVLFEYDKSLFLSLSMTLNDSYTLKI